ncbi:phosphoribosyltransferase [Dongia sp.]|uniref:phosphoribosyltransferase n=1 Tax=Dongia sp. TaxID=1977262 RepID=UPI0035B25134
MTFADRSEAGRRLGVRLKAKGFEKPIVYALPRGGLPVGFEVAKMLKCPLDIVLVRKIRAPFQPELALGAVVDGRPPEIVLNDFATQLQPSKEAIDAAARLELQELARRRAIYLAGRPTEPAKGRTAIVVDDGLATGATARAALRAMRRQEPKRLILAIPVAAVGSLRDLSREADEIICLEQPEDFDAVGAYYLDFTQLSDAEAVEILSKARANLV